MAFCGSFVALGGGARSRVLSDGGDHALNALDTAARQSGCTTDLARETCIPGHRPSEGAEVQVPSYGIMLDGFW